MHPPIRTGRALAAAAAALLLAGCPGGGDEHAPREARRDTANTSWEDGLSASQVQDKARALSPEEAEAAGLAVDTTIHLELPQESDTVFLTRPPQPTPPPVETPPAETVPPARP